MALRALQGPAGGSAPVGGSGTPSPSTIPRWTGPTTLGDSGLIDNGTAIYTTTRNVGFGTASPLCRVTTTGGGAVISGTVQANGAFLQDLTNYRGIYVGYDTAAQVGVIAGAGSSSNVAFWTHNGTSNGERARITLAGRFGLGTTSPISLMHINDPGANATYYTAGNTNNGMLFGVAASGQNLLMNYAASSIIVGAYNGGTPTQWINITSTSLDASAIAGYGLKLPATPGNADTQTLDCYAEGTWTPTLTGFGGTTPTVTSARYTRIGRVVTVQVALDATGGNTYSGTKVTTYMSLPSGMTPAISSCGPMCDSGINTLGTASAYDNGNLYLPTFAATIAKTFITILYTV